MIRIGREIQCLPYAGFFLNMSTQIQIFFLGLPQFMTDPTRGNCAPPLLVGRPWLATPGLSKKKYYDVKCVEHHHTAVSQSK